MTDSVPPAELPSASATAVGEPRPPSEPVKTDSPRRRRSPMLLLGVILGGALAGGGAWLGSEWHARQADSQQAALSDTVRALQAVIATANSDRDALRRDLAAARTDATRLTERLTALEGTGGTAATRAAEVQAQVGALATRLDALRAAPPPAAGADPAAVAAIERRMTALEAAAAAAPAGTPDPTARAAAEALAARLADTERALGDLRTAPSVAPAVAEARALAETLARQVTQMQARIDVAEQRARAADPAAARGAVVVTATQLRDRMRTPGAFTGELNAFRAATGPITDAALTAALDSVASIAARGAASTDDLRRNFDLAVDAALAAAEAAPEGWTGAVLRSVRDLVRVRRAGDVAGEDDAARVARARADLAQGNLAAALRELDAASTALRVGLAAWLAQAQARLTVEQASDVIAARAVALVAGGAALGAAPAAAPAAP